MTERTANNGGLKGHAPRQRSPTRFVPDRTVVQKAFHPISLPDRTGFESPTLVELHIDSADHVGVIVWDVGRLAVGVPNQITRSIEPRAPAGQERSDPPIHPAPVEGDANVGGGNDRATVQLACAAGGSGFDVDDGRRTGAHLDRPGPRMEKHRSDSLGAYRRRDAAGVYRIEEGQPIKVHTGLARRGPADPKTGCPVISGGDTRQSLQRPENVRVAERYRFHHLVVRQHPDVCLEKILLPPPLAVGTIPTGVLAGFLSFTEHVGRSRRGVQRLQSDGSYRKAHR